MDSIRTYFVGVGYKQHADNPSTTHHFAEIVIISNSHQSLNPLLYLLKKDAVERYDLIQAPKELISINNESFAMAGEVISIDKKKKLITLSNQHTVSYNYLILANGTEQICISSQPDGIVNGLQILIHALRIKKISPDLASSRPDFNSAKNPRFMSADSSAISLPPAIKDLIFKSINEDVPFNGVKKCLYEVIM